MGAFPLQCMLFLASTHWMSAESSQFESKISPYIVKCPMGKNNLWLRTTVLYYNRFYGEGMEQFRNDIVPEDHKQTVQWGGETFEA